MYKEISRRNRLGEVNILELGNLVFNPNTNQSYDCPDWIVALLRDLDRRLSIVMWNKTQKEYDSPFQNTGNKYTSINNIFEVQAYNWDDDTPQQYNFKFSYKFDYTPPINILISWYKYLGRDTTINLNWKEKSDEYVHSLIINMYNVCINEINLENPKD